jgi:tetratricopeptide (TPR) repeat protein
MRIFFLISLTVVLSCLPSRLRATSANPAFDAACDLFRQHTYGPAETAFRAIVQAQPDNAPACHYLARAILARLTIENPGKAEADTRTAEAAKWIERAFQLEPRNAAYMRDYGMSRIAGLSSMKKGRKLVEDSLALDANDAETHELLAVMYAIPWVVGGDSAKAAKHRSELQRLDPARFAISEVNRLLWNEKDYAAAFRFCEALAKNDSSSALSLYLYGYVAAEAKDNLARGLDSCKKALELPFSSPTGTSPYSGNYSAAPSYVWENIGKIERARGHVDVARDAFATAVKLDPANHWAAKSLASLPSVSK